MGDAKTEATKQKVAAEMKQLAKKMEKAHADVIKLRAEHDTLAKKKEPTDKDKVRQLDIMKITNQYFQACQADVNGTCGRITSVLKTDAPKDPKLVGDMHNDMAKWYSNMLAKEPGLKLGNGWTLSGELSFKEKKVMLRLNKSF